MTSFPTLYTFKQDKIANLLTSPYYQLFQAVAIRLQDIAQEQK
jgi:hypothetical protein